jgi:hypothetical protein
MIEANWFMVINKFGEFLVGRTDAPCQVKQHAFMPDGSPGKMIVAPAHFIETYRIQWMESDSFSPSLLLDKQQNLHIYKLAMLAWEDHFRVSLLR